MVKIGQYNLMKVLKEKPMGVFLDDGQSGILLPKRFVPPGTKVGDTLKVFLYHDSEDRVIATTQEPYGVLGDLVKLKAVSVGPQGAFLDWGLIKDLLLPSSRQVSFIRKGGEYLVKIMMDEKTGRLYATEKIDAFLSNKNIEVHEKAIVDLIVYRKTDLGFVVIINNKHTGLLYFNELFRPLQPGDRLTGFIKKIYPPNEQGDCLIDVGVGKPGYERVAGEEKKILALLQEANGYLPYHDKSSPEEIYAVFGMSKKTFKMTIGKLYKERKLDITESGIKLL